VNILRPSKDIGGLNFGDVRLAADLPSYHGRLSDYRNGGSQLYTQLGEESTDVVALMENLIVRDAQHPARCIELLVEPIDEDVAPSEYMNSALQSLPRCPQWC
jgi:hypothetical protein